MKKIIVLLLLVAIALPIKSIAFHEERFVIATDDYVISIPQDLAQQTVIENAYNVNLIPQILFNSKSVNISLIPTAGAFDNPSDSYVIEETKIVDDLEIHEKITMDENQIVSEVSIKNNGASAGDLEFSYTVGGNGGLMALFSPTIYDNRSSKYLVAMQPAYNGRALALIASQSITPVFSEILTASDYEISFGLPKVAAGATVYTQMTFYPFILKSEETMDYPVELYSFMSEPLVNVTGTVPSSSFTGGLDDKLTQAMELVAPFVTSNGEFSSFHSVDLNGTNFDSLDCSVLLKQICIANNVPCRLVIGKNGDMYYSWIRAFNGQWINVDIQNGLRQEPQYAIVYLEPQTELHVMTAEDEPKKMLLDGTMWIAAMGQLNFLVYFIAIIAVASAAVVGVTFRKDLINRLLPKRGVVTRTVVEVDGKYEILSEETDDAFLKEILYYIKDKGGTVRMDNMVESMRFSKELLEDGVRYLIDQKFVRKVM
jgi:hypothetical protein